MERIMTNGRIKIAIYKNFLLLNFAFVAFIAGCGRSYTPEITGVVPVLRPDNTQPLTPAPTQTVPGREFVYISKNIPADWFPRKSVEKKWKAIVIHHSGTAKGSARAFDNYHKSGNGWEGVGYDFVIGNGTSTGDGRVEVTFRWKKQMVGAHCRTDHTNWANKDAIGICLVGNFNKTVPTRRQIEALKKLTRFLSRRYGISKDRIYGHNTTPRHSTSTDCPGKRFSVKKFKAML